MAIPKAQGEKAGGEESSKPKAKEERAQENGKPNAAKAGKTDDQSNGRPKRAGSQENKPKATAEKAEATERNVGNEVFWAGCDDCPKWEVVDRKWGDDEPFRCTVCRKRPPKAASQREGSLRKRAEGPSQLLARLREAQDLRPRSPEKKTKPLPKKRR